MWFEITDGFESRYLLADSQEDAEQRALLFCVGPTPATNAIATFAEMASIKLVSQECVDSSMVISCEPAPVAMVDELAAWRKKYPRRD